MKRYRIVDEWGEPFNRFQLRCPNLVFNFLIILKMEIDQIYENCYTVYQNNLDNTEIKEKIEKILFEVDELYGNAQSVMYDKLLEIEKIAGYVFLNSNQKENATH